MLLRIMERHSDWGAVIALVGGGQEINDGEAGLEEWGRALAGTSKSWNIYSSPEAVRGGSSVAGTRLYTPSDTTLPVNLDDDLHLRVSVRSLKATTFAEWVNFVVDGDAASAARLNISDKFPIFLSRDLALTRHTLLANTLGDRKCGLVGSSGAARLRAEGLEPSSSFHAEYPWEHWYLARRDDVRSSDQLEVFATEFEIQGLELDWIGLCWGGDFVRTMNSAKWCPRTFRFHGSKWSPIKRSSKMQFRENAYSVLLTRARQGLVIYIPRGSSDDPTRDPGEFDEIEAFLLTCGANKLKADIPPEQPPPAANNL